MTTPITINAFLGEPPDALLESAIPVSFWALQIKSYRSDTHLALSDDQAEFISSIAVTIARDIRDGYSRNTELSRPISVTNMLPMAGLQRLSCKGPQA
jgi:hypothetical protein